MLKSMVNDHVSHRRYAPFKLRSGVLAMARAKYYASYDPAVETEPTWQEYFGEIISAGLPQIWSNVSGATINGLFPLFDLKWALTLSAHNANYSGDRMSATVEFIDAAGNSIFAFKCGYLSTFAIYFDIGPNLNNLTRVSKTTTSAYVLAAGIFTFQAGLVTYTDNAVYPYAHYADFTFPCNIQECVAIRFTDLYALSPSGGDPNFMLRITDYNDA